MGTLPVTHCSADTCRCDEKADIFSYGVLLWELITQQHPRRGCLRDLQVLSSSIKHVKLACLSLALHSMQQQQLQKQTLLT